MTRWLDMPVHCSVLLTMLSKPISENNHKLISPKHHSPFQHSPHISSNSLQGLTLASGPGTVSGITTPSYLHSNPPSNPNSNPNSSHASITTTNTTQTSRLEYLNNTKFRNSKDSHLNELGVAALESPPAPETVSFLGMWYTLSITCFHIFYYILSRNLYFLTPPNTLSTIPPTPTPNSPPTPPLCSTLAQA